MANPDYIVECDNLVKIYKTRDIEVLALQGLELSVKRGELMAIIGNSGSGKSTFLNMLGALDRLQPNNAQGEYYLTDVPAILRRDGELVRVYTRQLNEELLGVNTLEQLEEAERYLSRR